jgi:hypothetical protein
MKYLLVYCIIWDKSIQLMTAKLMKYNSLESPNLYFLLMPKITCYKFLLQTKYVRSHKRDACARGVRANPRNG